MPAAADYGFRTLLRGKNNLRKLTRALASADSMTYIEARALMNAEMQAVFQETQAEVPVRGGDLQKSGKVHKIKTISRSRLSGAITYGSPDVGRTMYYALIQHETPPSEFKHSTGKWKYVSDPMMRHRPQFKKMLREIFKSGLNLSFRSAGFYKVANIWR